MTQFNAGDIVEYIGWETQELKGAFGSVISDDRPDRENIDVAWFCLLGGEKSGRRFGVHSNNIRVVVGEVGDGEI